MGARESENEADMWVEARRERERERALRGGWRRVWQWDGKEVEVKEMKEGDERNGEKGKKEEKLENMKWEGMDKEADVKGRENV